MAYYYGDITLDDPYARSKGWAADLADFFQMNKGADISYIGNLFKNDKENNKFTNSKYLNSLTDSELGALLSQFYTIKHAGDISNRLGNSAEYLDFNSINKYLQQLEDLEGKLGAMPNLPDYDKIYNDALASINKENNELLGMLDSDMLRQTNMYNNELNNINRMYEDSRRDILSSNYRNNASLMGTVGSQMDKARRNALESGASAGLRLAENVNTLLSTQNKMSQQSLETSNQLAQQLLNQRQAAMGVRQNYNNALTSNNQQKIGIKQGTAERANAYANSQFDTQQKIYENDMGRWEDKYNSATAGNPFAESYRSYYKKNQYGY